MAEFEIHQPGINADVKYKSPLLILLLGFIRRLELQPISEQKAENIPAGRQVRRPAMLPVQC